jgi:hypothetical protein
MVRGDLRHQEVRVAADAVADAADASKAAEEVASAAVARRGIGLTELKRAVDSMEKAAQEHTLTSKKIKAAENVEMLEAKAERLQAEASQASLIATEAENEAANAEQAAALASEEMIACRWKMSPMCAPTFEYMGVRYDSCINDDDETWCSHHDIYEGGWSRCSFACEPRSKMFSVVQQTSSLAQATNTTLGAKNLPAVSLLDTQKQDPNDEVHGASAKLDETGYSVVAALCDSSEMTRFVRRLISAIGCRITDQNALVGFVPWYSGEADVQTYEKLDGELRCLCTRGQGPQWLEPIDPNDPPTGGLLKCTGRRCNEKAK